MTASPADQQQPDPINDALLALETALDTGSHVRLSHADVDTIRAVLEGLVPIRVYLVMTRIGGECEIARRVCATREYAERCSRSYNNARKNDDAAAWVEVREVDIDATVLRLPVQP